MWKVQLSQLNYDNAERSAVSAVIDDRWLTMGARNARFEEAFSEFLSDTDASCITTSSCTAALHIALLAIGVGPGDEVIIPALNFVAGTNVVRVAGATPVLADSASLDDWNVPTQRIAEKITDRTKCVIVMHYAGYPCDMEAISALCAERDLFLIEDAAHAPGARVGGRACGTWGDIGCFSFFSNKNLAVGEGGMLVTKSERLLQTASYFRAHGMTSLTLDRHRGRATTYDVAISGLNYRLDEMRAALGLEQLKKLGPGNLAREKLVDRYRSRLEGTQIVVPFADVPHGFKSAFHIMPTLLPESLSRDRVIERMKTKKIQTSIHYPAQWEFSAFGEIFDKSEYPVVEQICRRELTLPLYPTLTPDEVDYVAESLVAAVEC